MMSVQLNDGPEFFSPAPVDDDDTLPLTNSSMLQPSTSRDGASSRGQNHDRSRGSSFGRSSGLSVRFVGSTSGSPSGSRLGDSLHALEGGESGVSRSPSSRQRSLSPSAADSPLARTGTMLRKMSQRVVNVSNEQVDTIVSRNMRRRSTMRRPSQVPVSYTHLTLPTIYSV